MRAVVVRSPGGYEALEIDNVCEPVPGPEEVLIETAYCGCNWADTQIRAGKYPYPVGYPLTPGVEVSGVVITVGANVRNIPLGTRVAAILPQGGGYAEKCVASADRLMPLPACVPMSVAAAFPAQALTAYHMLHTVYRIRPGDVVLTHAVGGGVGLYVTQLANMANAKVIGTVGTAGKELKALQFGAYHVINLAREDFVEAVLRLTNRRGADLAIDSLGGDVLDRTFAAVAPMGHIINIGEARGVPFNNIRERLLPRSQTFTRFNVLLVEPGSAQGRGAVEYLLQRISDGSLKVPIVATFPLDKAGEMHQLMEGRSVSGKLLLRPGTTQASSRLDEPGTAV
jgi:NADPH2:quinone reductase